MEFDWARDDGMLY